MRRSKRTAVVAVLTAVGAVAIGALATGATPFGGGLGLTDVPTANTRSAGFAPASKLSPELAQVAVAQGSTKVENPTRRCRTTATTTTSSTRRASRRWCRRRLCRRGPQDRAGQEHLPRLQERPLRRRPELRLRHALPLPGPRGRVNGAGYITRINLDADAAHRVTLLATTDATGAPIADDRRLDLGPVGPAAPLHDGEPDRTDLLGHAGLPVDRRRRLRRARPRRLRGHPERRRRQHLDRRGHRRLRARPARRRRSPTASSSATCPAPGDLANGKLQVLQVLNAAGTPITSDVANAAQLGRPARAARLRLDFQTRWMTIHDTATDGTAPFNANTLAKAHDGTPFKRPENGNFRPGSHFREFFFDETGDTNATSPENANAGGWGSLFKLTQSDPSADAGRSRSSTSAMGRRPASTTSRSSRKTRSRWSRTRATRCTASATRSTPATRSTST